MSLGYSFVASSNPGVSVVNITSEQLASVIPGMTPLQLMQLKSQIQALRYVTRGQFIPPELFKNLFTIYGKHAGQSKC
jgi:hypothetical protein